MNNRYKINTSKLIEIENPGRGGIDKEKLFNISLLIKTDLITLRDQVIKIINQNKDDNIVYLEYINIPAKTRRLTFNKKSLNISSIPQKGLHTFSDSRGLITRLFYQLDQEMLNWLLVNLNEIILAKSHTDIPHKAYDEFLKK